MKIHTNEYLPLLVTVTTTLSIIIGFLALNSGVYFIFQNLFYIPIVITCILLYQAWPPLLHSSFSTLPRHAPPICRSRIHLDREDDGHSIRIRDNGIEVPVQAQEKIFEPFHIADQNTLSRQYNRLGLGLPIAQRYVQLHGGRIAVESRPGEGSTFTVWLPEKKVGEE